MNSKRSLAALALFTSITASKLDAQTLFGSGCAGASGVTPTMAVSGTVKSGQNWTLEVTAPGGIGLGYMLIGFSNTTASAFGGLPLPLDLGVLFADPLWSGCWLNVDPSYALRPYFFDPNSNGGLASFTFPGWDIGTVYMQAINIDADFATRIAGVSRGLAIRRTAPAGMVAIEPGTFEMGSNAPDTTPYFNSSLQQPVHTVTISYPFWMGQHEVTQAEYVGLMGTNPSFFVGADRPVENLTKNTAVAYCAALNAAESLAGNVPDGYAYRLPTEAEWEYVCRAGTTTEFGVGNGVDLFCTDAQFGFSYHSNSSCGNPSGSTAVGSYAPNAWGLFDMHGNVSEWCLDSFASYPVGPVTDPFVTGGVQNITRGGAYHHKSDDCRSAHRTPTVSGAFGTSTGFRVVLAPVLVTSPGLVSIQPGTFEMGSNAPSDSFPYFNTSLEQPAHTVTISYPFWMGRHEVTQAEYQAVMGSNPSTFVGTNLPVETVSWDDARAYCAALTAAESLAGNVPFGHEYRLPTEAEWEYACRAGTTTEFNVGAALLCSDARFEATYHQFFVFLVSCGNPAGTVGVGSYLPNAWGLYDMHGNVSEWCLDSLASYSAGLVTDPFVTGGLERATRGGGWFDDSNRCRSANRVVFSLPIPNWTNSSRGFRVVLAPVLVP